MGWQAHLVHEDVIKQVVEQHPRLKWSGCFSKAIEAEIEVCCAMFDKGRSENIVADSLTRPNLGATRLLFQTSLNLWLTTRSWSLTIRLSSLVLSTHCRLVRGILEEFDGNSIGIVEVFRTV